MTKPNDPMGDPVGDSKRDPETYQQWKQEGEHIAHATQMCT